MILIRCVIMFLTLTLCPVLLVAVQTLTIDSQLGTSIEDCFERLSIGEQLARNALYRNISELTTRECEQLCKQDKQCQSYDYGVGAKGNATCNLSNANEKDLKEKSLLTKHPDYDIYVRRFQCEQSPPSPFQPQFDDPEDGSGPIHRPVYRPDEDSRRPVDDYLSDSQIYETLRPDLLKPIVPYRPPYYSQLNDRPDDYHSQKPAFDDAPSYGDHRPPEIPYKPQNFRPVLHNQTYKPDPYDVLHFQTPYRPSRPLDPGFWRPDPYHPPDHNDEIPDLYGSKPIGNKPNSFHDPYELEKPVYHYIVRPHRKPKPQNDPKPHPGQDYYSQYASGYGSQDNSVQVQIYDPPRPYRPAMKPLYDKPLSVKPSYGMSQSNYGQDYGYGNQGGYGNQHDTSTQLHGQGSVTEIHNSQNHQRPQSDSGYSQSPSLSDSSYNHFGSNYQDERPNKRPYQSNRYPNQNDHGSYSSNQYYGSNERPSHGSHLQDNQPSYGQTQKPNDFPQKPVYPDPQNQGYGTSLGGYEDHYNHHPSDESYQYPNSNHQYGANPGYSEKPIYDEKPIPSKPIYKPDYHLNDYKPNYYNPRPSYDQNRPGFSNYRPILKPLNKPLQDPAKPDNGYEIPNDQNPLYQDSNRPDPQSDDVTNHEAGYNANGDDYKNSRPNINDNFTQTTSRPGVKPVYEFDIDRPNNVPSYIAKPGGNVVTSRPVSVGDYGGKPAYGREPGYGMYRACFRRVLAGRRALRSFVRKVVACERLEDCRTECAAERRFPCESFNYRLDPSFRGKGLCELMTKPIEAFDVRRDFVEDKDYDFFEVDRNSLEPNCQETYKGPGYLHSGFLSSKPDRLPGYQNQWSDRADYDYTRYRGHNRYHEDRWNQRRRHQDRFYVPYQIGIARSDDADIENWGTYGGSYGGDYYKDRNDYHKSISHWRLPNELNRQYGVKPGLNREFDYSSLGKDNFLNTRYGLSWKTNKWNRSGSWSRVDDADNYYDSKRYQPVEREDISFKDCSSRRRPGMSLGSGAVRRSLIAHNVVECEAACFQEREFKCVSYSYRYSNSRGTDNCFLSERPYRGLELSADSGSDVYAMPQDQGCSTVNHRPWVESECFWHVRSEVAVSGTAVRAALTVAGLGACEAECIRAHAFFCRGFSFRFDSPTIGDDLENCILTSSPPTSLEAGIDLRSNVGHELYARGNYGRGCEPALYDDVHYREKQCYLQYDNAAKLIGGAIRGRARVSDEQSCGEACTEAPFRCLSFSYNNNAPPDIDNCLLSEIRLFDLQRGVDYEHSANDWLFAFDLFNGQCWRKIHGKTDYEEHSPELPRPLTGPSGDTYPGSNPSGPSYSPGVEPPLIPGPILPSGPDYKPEPPHHEKPVYPPPSGPAGPSSFKPGYHSEPSGPSYLPIPGFRPSEPTGPGYNGFKPGFRPSEPTGSDYDGFKPGYRPGSHPGYLPNHEVKPFRPVGPERPGYSDYPGGYPPGDRYPERPKRPGIPGDREDKEPISVSWRHYTVSGFPCRTGTSCAQNQVAGHWACEPEGGEVGSWDYCCAPTHRCGYSEGFHKPWCYVGTAEDQWRPCSEKYYPYHQHNVPHPSQGHRGEPPYSRPSNHNYNPDRIDRPTSPYLPEEDRRYWDDLYRNGPKAYYDKYGNPLPGYTRVPPVNRPYIRYRHNYPRPGSGSWVPLHPSQPLDQPPVPGGLGVPRYWPVAYLHKGPPPNITYFMYNETKTTTTTTENYQKYPNTPPKEQPPLEFNKTPEKPNDVPEARSHRDEKTRNITAQDIFQLSIDITSTTTTTKKPVPKEVPPTIDSAENVAKSEVESIETENAKSDKESENLKGIDDKLADITGPIEVLDIEDAKTGDKLSDLKTLEAEEKQIEAIGRLLASRRGSKLIIEKRSQKDLESKNIAVDKDLVDFNFGNKFPTERRGIIQKVTKDEIERDRNADKSLEVSETTFVRPPRVLSTTENIRKAIVNGKVFYDATIREQRDLYINSTRKNNFRQLEDFKAPSVIANNNFGKKKIIKARNVNPVRRVRRVYRKRYNPEEVRRRLLEKERMMRADVNDTRKI